MRLVVIPTWVTLSKKYCSSSLLVLIITFQIINIYPSLARRLNEPLQRIEQPIGDFNTSSSLSVSTDIPHLDITIDLARMSSLVYGFRTENAQNCSSFSSIYDDFISNESVSNDALNPMSSNYIYDCLMYERDDQDTQVLIVSRTTATKFPFSHSKEDYIAVIFAGTDDFRNALTDSDLLTRHFGPTHADTNRTYTFPSHEMNIRVHAGFNNAVFKHGLFDRIFDVVRNFKIKHNNAKIFTTGHSLGASDSVLTAVALKIQPELSNDDIHSINFGCPKTGNHEWKRFVNSIEGLGIWRVVNGIDLVPRLPGVRFHHVGHTVQLDNRSAKGYWLHEGNKTLGYAGVSFGWNTLPYVLAPAAAIEHIISRYISYLKERSKQDPKTHYIDGFETIDSNNDDNDGFKDDSLPPSDDFTDELRKQFANQYAHDYMVYAKLDRIKNFHLFSVSSQDVVENM